jgi:hypothetical protein
LNAHSFLSSRLPENYVPAGQKEIAEKMKARDSLILDKFYSMSCSIISSLLQNTELRKEFIFRVSKEEHEIITLKCNTLLLGRSGTGKD